MGRYGNYIGKLVIMSYLKVDTTPKVTPKDVDYSKVFKVFDDNDAMAILKGTSTFLFRMLPLISSRAAKYDIQYVAGEEKLLKVTWIRFRCASAKLEINTMAKPMLKSNKPITGYTRYYLSAFKEADINLRPTAMHVLQQEVDYRKEHFGGSGPHVMTLMSAVDYEFSWRTYMSGICYRPSNHISGSGVMPSINHSLSSDPETLPAVKRFWKVLTDHNSPVPEIAQYWAMSSRNPKLAYQVAGNDAILNKVASASNLFEPIVYASSEETDRQHYVSNTFGGVLG